MGELIKKDVRTIKVFAKCECGGELKPTGMCLASNPPQYPHICNKCGKSENLRYRYPRIEYEEIDTPKEESAIEHYLKEEIRITKERLLKFNTFFNGVDVGHENSVKLLNKHIFCCEHLLKMIAKEREE